MPRRLLLCVAIVLVPLAVSGGRRTVQHMMQAVEADRGWVLTVDQRRARLEAADGARQSFRVRRNERWLSLSEFGGGWMAAGIRLADDRIDLSLVASFGRGVRRLRSPDGRQGALRTRPVPLVSTHRAEGLAWLEGDSIDSLAVRAAVFDDGSFRSTETLSPPGAGPQSGLNAVVLADGTWLLVWSRFDGTDDELYWVARYPGGAWTAPRRVTHDNRTPDVTPALIAHGDGALLAWSRLEDEYEVLTARYSAGVWTTPRKLGVRGSLYPTFRRMRERDYLLVRNAWPAGWSAFRYGDSGRPSEVAVVPAEASRPPVLVPRAGSGLAFEWPDRERAVLSWEPLP